MFRLYIDDLTVTETTQAGPTGYCTPSFGSNTDCITYFELGSIRNSTAASSTNGYGDYTSQSTDLTRGATVSASLTSGAGTGTHAAAVWIDFNDDNTFDSSTERVGTQGSISPSTNVSISLTIPNNATLGSHRLRVVYQYNVTATNIDPCASASYGEAEDYTVNIIAAATPYNITLNQTTGGTITASVAGGTATSSNTTATAGQSVTLTATANSGYVFSGWNVSGVTGTANSTTYTFTMPAGNVTASATFIQPPTVISSLTDWNNFAAAVNGGYSYSGQTVYLAADITGVSTMVGTSTHPFTGTFDGTYNGTAHSIAVSLGSSSSPISEQGAAPFRYINGASIQNLTVTGNVYSNQHHAAGLIGFATDGSTNVILNCHVSTNVTNGNAYDGDSGNNYMGGLIGHNLSATLWVGGCVYDGTLTSQGFKGGMVGFGNYNSNVTIVNSYFAGAFSANGYSYDNFSPIACHGSGRNFNFTFSNFYYNTDIGTFSASAYEGTVNASYTTDGRAKHAYSVTGMSPVTVAMSGNPISNGTYSVSGLTFYNPGFVYGSTLYGGSDETLPLTLSGGASGASYFADHGILTQVSGSSYTLLMEANDTQIGSAESVPYTQDFENDSHGWAFVNGSCTNQWYWGSLGANDSNNGLYISNDNGTTNAYTLSSISVVYVCKLLNFTEAGVYNLSFDLRQKGESTWDCVGAMLYSPSATPEATTTSAGNGLTAWPSGYAVMIGGAGLDLSNGEWVRASLSFEVTQAGVYKLVLAWKNDSSGGAQPPASIDNVSVKKAFTVTASAEPSNMGMVQIDNGTAAATATGTCDIGSNVTLTATANANCAFHNWTENGQVVSTDPSYTIQNLSANHNLVANFGIEVTVTTNPASTECLASGTQVTLTASASVKCKATDYTFTRVTGSYSELSSPTTILAPTTGTDGLGCNIATFPDEFTFNYCGTPYTGIYISDGVLRFGSNSMSYGSGMLSSASYVNLLAPFCTDLYLKANTGSISYKLTGTAPNRVLTIQFKNITTYSDNSTTNYFNFQVKLYEDGMIEFCYGSGFSSITAYYSSAYTCIGINSLEGSTVYYQSITPTIGGATVQTSGTLTKLTVEQAHYLTSGTIYRFTPPQITYTWTYTGTAGTANGDTYTVTPTVNSTYTATTSFNGVSGYETVEVTVAPAAPTNLSVSNLTSNSAIVSWSVDGQSSWEYSIDNGTTWVTTLTPSAELSNLNKGTTYTFLVKTISGNCESAEASIGFTTLTYKRFVSDGNWNDGSKWLPVGAPDDTEDISIEANAIIPAGVIGYANNILPITNGSITIKDGGQLVHNNPESSKITMTVENEIAGYGAANANTNKGYELISFPVNGLQAGSSAITGMLTQDPYDLYRFNIGSDPLEWEHLANNTNIGWYQGLLYASQEGTTITVTGDVIGSADLYVNAIYTLGNGVRFDGWTLLGNPFVCNAYASAGIECEDPNEANFYCLNHTTNYDEFVPFDNSTPIKPMEGIMFRVFEDDNYIIFSRTAPSGAKTGILNVDVRKATTRGTETLDRARVRFGEGRNLGKIQFDTRHTKIYIPDGDKDFSVYYAEGAGTIPVNFKAQDNGRYTLDFSTESIGFNYLHLIDNMNGNDVDLLQTPYYAFDAKATDFASRFTLVFATGNDNGETFAFFNNGLWIINNPSTGSGQAATLQVVDALGRILSSENITGSCSKAINAAPGVYMLRLINGDNVKVQKITVNR